MEAVKKTLIFGVLVFLLCFAHSSFAANPGCSEDSARKLLQPFLNSNEKILNEKCKFSSNAPHDLDARGNSTCVSSWKKMNYCAESYLAKREQVCGGMGSQDVSVASQTSGFQSIQKTHEEVAALHRSLASQLKECIAEARKSQAALRKVAAKLSDDKRKLDAKLKASPDPEAVLGLERIGK
jgi:hypothetical protein